MEIPFNWLILEELSKKERGFALFCHLEIASFGSPACGFASLYTKFTNVFF